MTKKQAEAHLPSRLLCGICFSLCFFAFMLTEAVVNERGALLLGSRAVNLLYAFGLVCTGLGFLSFSLVRNICRAEGSRKAALLLAGRSALRPPPRYCFRTGRFCFWQAPPPPCC